MSTKKKTNADPGLLPQVGGGAVLLAEKWVQNGYTLSHTPSGLPVFLHGVLPGEKADVRFTKVTQSHAFARAANIVSPAPGRGENDCSAFPECGGCSFRHISYQEEVELKLKLLRDMKHIASCLDENKVEVFRADADHSRNHAQLQAGRSGLGFFALHTNDVVPLPKEGCRQLSPALNKAIAEYPAGGRGRLIFRDTSDGVFGPEDMEKNILLGAELGDRPSAKGVREASTWRFPSTGFFQVNRFLLIPWLERIRTWVPAGRPETAELFCGSGVIGGYCRSVLGRYTGFENAGASVDAAEYNFRGHEMNGKFERVDLYRVQPRLENASLVIVNPPRSGMKERLAESLVRGRVDTIVYSSCSPQTLNRDLGILLRGFRCSGIALFDFFPRTPHVEVVVRLERIAREGAR